MGDLTIHSRIRRSLLLAGTGAFAAQLLPAQRSTAPDSELDDGRPPVRLPNGKLQQDEILKTEYAQNLKDAQELVSTARSFEEDLEKDDRFVLSLSSLKKLDDMERLTKRIRGRMKHY